MKEEKTNNKNETGKLTIFKKKEIWISGVIGILVGAILIYVLGVTGILGLQGATIATIKNERITEKELYDEMKKYSSVSYILELVDKSILKDKYELTEEQKSEVAEQVDYYINMYSSYGYTEEAFLEEAGFESKDEFKEYLTLDYKRNLCYIDYLKPLISDEEINNYYNENVYGEINTKYILVEVSEDITDEEALKTANEIIAKLNAGGNFDDVAKEYEGKVVFEELGYNGFNSGLADEYVSASKELENNTYSKEPVKTEFGYHIIYKIDQKEQPTLEEVKSDIIEILGKDLETEDQYLKHKALIKLREDNNLKIKDDKFKQEYEDFCKQVNTENEQS
ncbi:MAG: peptidylprolyl isomerase [Clostridia bacterium]|nr:peptidylprolyl isomerase [Clostridia bacterium]